MTVTTSSNCSLSVNPPSLTFTGGAGGTWKDYQTVTVSAAEEDSNTACGTGVITIARTAGPLPMANVTVSADEADNDVVAIYVDPIDARVPEGEETTVKVRLSRDPGGARDVLFNAVTGGDADIKIGFPDATRTDPNIDFAAPFTPPSPVPNVNFSVRWTGKLNIPASGDWQFHTTAADGVRLWIKDDSGKWAPVIMDWNFATAAPREAYGPVDELNQLTTIALSAGYHDFRMEYFRGNTVPAEVHLRWTGPGISDQIIPAASFRLPDDSGPGLKGDYYSNTNLSTTPNYCDAVRIDPQVAFDFVATPSPVGSTNLSVRWTGWVRPAETGEYTFYTRSDDGVRLWVNGIRLINNWTYHGDTLDTGTPKLNLTAGQDYAVTLEYMQGTGAALIRLEWQKTGWSSRVVVPESCLRVPDKSRTGLKGEYFRNVNLTPLGYGLTFDATRPWNVPQDMRFYAEEDGDWTNGTASFTAACSGAANTGMTISASEVDNDDPPITFVTSTDVVRALEGDAAGKSFRVRLSRAPSFNVAVTAARTSGDTDISVSSGGTLTFTPANWNVDQTVTVVAAEDGDDFNGSAVITLSGRGVGGQVSVTSKSVTAWEVDNDSVQIYTDPDTVTAVEQGAGQTLNVRLSKQPAANVVVSQAVSNQSNCSFTVAPAGLTFTTANWNTPQAFTVTAGADDANAISGTATLTLTSTAGGGTLTMGGERATLMVQGSWDDARGTFNHNGGQVWLRGSPSGTDTGLPIVHKTSNRFRVLVIDPWPQIADYTVTTSLAAQDIVTFGGTTLRCPGGNIYIYGVFRAMGELVLGGGSRIHLNMPGGNGFPNSYLEVTGPSSMIRTEGTTGFHEGGYVTIGASDTTTAWVRLAGGVNLNYVYFRRLYWDYYNTTSCGLQLDGAYDATRILQNVAFNSEGVSVSDSPTAYIYIRSSKWNGATIRRPQFYKASGWQDPYKAIAAVSNFSGCKLYIEDYILGGTGGGRYPGAINRLLYENPPATDPHVSGDYAYTADSITTWYHWRYSYIGSGQGVIQWRNPISPTPVGIVSFQAAAEPDGTVRLTWTTGAERDNAAFRIYRVCEGAEDRVAEIRGAVSSAEPREYAFVDAGAPPGRKVQYKLVSVTTGGDENMEGATEVKTPAVPVKTAVAAATAAYDPSAGAAPASVGGSGVPTVRPVSGRPVSKYAAAGAAKAGRLPEGDAVRIECRSEGPCFVPAAELPGGVALSRSLLHGDSRVPVLARTTAGGRRGLLFFARKDPSLYSDSNVYWMRAARGPKPKASGIAFAKGAPDVTTYTATVRAEEDEFFFGNPYIEDARDSWYFSDRRQLSSDGAPFRVTLAVSDRADGEAGLRIGLASYTESPDVSPDHAAEVRVNGTPVARLEWDGKRYAEFEVPVPDWLLVEGDNDIELKGMPVEGVAFSWSFMDYVELSYRRSLRASGGMLDAWVDAPAGSRVVVSGINDPKPWVVDATVPGGERMLKYRKEKDGGGWKIVVPAPGGRRRLVVCERSAAAGPAGVTIETVRRIGRADYVMVVPEGWKEAAGVQALAAYHSARGLKVAIVTPRECCDLTGARSVGPDGIRAYLKAAGARYALLVGDTHYDYLHRTTDRDTLVPAFLVHTWELGDIPTDAPFADADGDGRPEVAVGRLPVADVRELAVVADKIASAPAGTAAATVVADGEPMFESGADALAASVSEGAPARVLRASYDGAGRCREEMLEAIARGDRLVAYIGHASIDRLGKTAPILSAADAAEMTGSGGGVLLGATCVINYFGGTSARHPCLGEALLKAPGGPAAVVGSAGFTASPMQDELANAVASYLLGPGGRSSAVGEALVKAKRDMLGRSDSRYRSREFADVMRAYMVLGDPAYVPGNGGSGR
ncbi:MAG: PA14 domain-containing protein [Planctomycetota bacterium]|nr:PA14 domain-containing protein [Planctomycetota bacterium]